MAQTICRMFANRSQALTALEAMKLNGYEDCFLFDAEGGGGTHAGVVDAMCRAHILKNEAQIYAEGIMKGGAMIALHAQFGMAARATHILDSHQPIPSGIPEPPIVRIDWDEQRPFSSALQLPLLTPVKLPFEWFWNIPSLMRPGFLLSSLFGLGFRTGSATPLSSSIGMATLTSCATPFSSLLKMPLLSRR
jgi:hypothetical protein